MTQTSESSPLPLIYEACKPKDDVRSGLMADAEFAADLSMVLRKEAPDEYLNPAIFFANTYPTRGLRNLLTNVCDRLSHGTGVASIFRLDTSYGGGKTHGLIALVHAAQSGRSITNIDEFVSRESLPSGEVRIAAFDGENADPANGRLMEPGLRAFTPWGELAWQLGGRKGYELVKPSDVARIAPGADTLRELFAGQPTLILLDELSVYLRKIASLPEAREQLTAFLTAIFKAVENSPNAVLVYTLAVGKDGKASDAYGAENQFIAQQMAELESVSARKATILNPTEDDETVQVLKRRLFASVDQHAAEQVVQA
jgi:predicted AAA+ superfamily ATPase